MLSLLQDVPIDVPASTSLGGLEDLLGAAAVLFVLFLVVATVAEQILELFRGTLEGFGITLLKGGLSLEQAQKIAAEVLPKESVALAKANAQVALGDEYEKTLGTKKADIEALRSTVSQAIGPQLTDQIDPTTNAALSSMTAEVRTLVAGLEARRVYVLRLLSCAVCCVLCYFAGFNAFEIAAAELNFDIAVIKGLPGQILTGFAAASGSSYWHDALDKIRAAKQSIGQMQKVVSV